MKRLARRLGIGMVAVVATLIGIPASATYAGNGAGHISHPDYYQVWIFHQRYSGKCMDVRNNSDNVGAYVQQYDCNQTRAQDWDIDWLPGSTTTFTLVAGNGLCLEDRSSFMFNGAPVDVAQCNPWAPQMQWRFVGDYLGGPDNDYQVTQQIQNVQNPRCLDNEFNTDNWHILLLKDCGTPTPGGGGWWNQQWYATEFYPA